MYRTRHVRSVKIIASREISPLRRHLGRDAGDGGVGGTVESAVRGSARSKQEGKSGISWWNLKVRVRASFIGYVTLRFLRCSCSRRYDQTSSRLGWASVLVDYGDDVAPNDVWPSIAARVVTTYHEPNLVV